MCKVHKQMAVTMMIDEEESNEYLSFYGFQIQRGITRKNDIQAQPLGTRK
jgi:hypothetical protein